MQSNLPVRTVTEDTRECTPIKPPHVHNEPIMLPARMFQEPEGTEFNTCLGCRVFEKYEQDLQSIQEGTMEPDDKSKAGERSLIDGLTRLRTDVQPKVNDPEYVYLRGYYGRYGNEQVLEAILGLFLLMTKRKRYFALLLMAFEELQRNNEPVVFEMALADR
ncbi:MAG: hypothetical protein M1828_001601 [Chrysothrix sp. TS-e1954]|nr:MAG: hypothetical protein M1828_001601 [Chrysothrix sp. TS-e1954]